MELGVVSVKVVLGNSRSEGRHFVTWLICVAVTLGQTKSGQSNTGFFFFLCGSTTNESVLVPTVKNLLLGDKLKIYKPAGVDSG